MVAGPSDTAAAPWADEDEEEGLLDQAELEAQLAAMRAALGSSYLSLTRDRGASSSAQREARSPTLSASSSSDDDEEGEGEGDQGGGVGGASGAEEDDEDDLLAGFDFGAHVTELQRVLGEAYRSLGSEEDSAGAGQQQGQGARASAEGEEAATEAEAPATPEKVYNSEATALKMRNLRKHESILAAALAANRKTQDMLRSQTADIDTRLERNEALNKAVKQGLRKVREAQHWHKSAMRPARSCVTDALDPDTSGEAGGEAQGEGSGSAPAGAGVARDGFCLTATQGSLPVTRYWRGPLGTEPEHNLDTLELKPYYKAIPLLCSVSSRDKPIASGQKQAILEALLQTVRLVQLEDMLEAVKRHRSVTRHDLATIQAALQKLTLRTEGVADLIAELTDEEWAEVGERAGLTPRFCRVAWQHHLAPELCAGPWTSEEDGRLLAAVEHSGSQDWFAVAAHVGGARTAANCLQRFQATFSSSIKASGVWLEEELARLRHAVSVTGQIVGRANRWFEVAQMVGTRSAQQCFHRWTRRGMGMAAEGRGERTYSPWTGEEDEALRRAVGAFGAGKWTLIAATIPNRTDVQCRDRWVGRLDPSLHKRGRMWTVKDLVQLEKAVKAHTSAETGRIGWQKVAEKIPGCSVQMCRDKWYHSPQMRQAREAHEAANPLVRQHRETAGAVLRKRAPAAQMRKLKKPNKQPRKRKAQAQAQLGSSTAAPSEPPATVTAAASPRVVAPPRAVSWVIPAAPVVSAPPLPAMLRLEERRMRDGTAAATIQRLTNSHAQGRGREDAEAVVTAERRVAIVSMRKRGRGEHAELATAARAEAKARWYSKRLRANVPLGSRRNGARTAAFMSQWLAAYTAHKAACLFQVAGHASAGVVEAPGSDTPGNS